MSTVIDGNSPYISLVVAARNDNHGGNMLGRMQAFLDSWLEQARRYDLPSEIVVVEWNPPRERPRLKDGLQWPADMGPCAVRFIEVPAEVHRTIPNSVAIPLHQMIGKNVGIRRARGQFVLATNLDIIFSAALMQFLAERRLEPRKFYRMDRYDVASEIPARTSIDDLLAFCDSHILRVFAREGAFDTPGERVRPVERGDIVLPDSGIRLGEGWYGLEFYDDLRMRYPEPEAEIVFDRPASAPPRMMFEVESGPSARGGWAELEVLDPRGSKLASCVVNGLCKLRLSMPAEVSSGKIRLRIRNGGIPLLFEPRLLDLRFFAIRWGDRGWLEVAEKHPSGVKPAVSREQHFTVAPEPGSRLVTFDVTVTDSAGNFASFSADPADFAGFDELSEYQVAWQVGFREKDIVLNTAPAPESAGGGSGAPGWHLEVTGRRPSVDWGGLFQMPSPHAAHMRNVAYLHANACGDFTLLSRDDWFALRAYPEFPIWPMHVDSLLLYAAHHAGVREVILRDPMRIYHIQHLSGAGWTPEGEKERNARIAAKGVATIEYAEFLKYIHHMRRFNAPLIFSPANWGLDGISLPETTP